MNALTLVDRLNDLTEKAVELLLCTGRLKRKLLKLFHYGDDDDDDDNLLFIY
jgi:hypothetical protein